jgi:hypothetical protein
MEKRPDHVSRQRNELFAEAPGGGTRPVMFKGKEEEKQSAKELKIEVGKRDAVLVLTDERDPSPLEAIVEGYSGHHAERLVEESEFGGEVVILRQRIIVEDKGFEGGGGKEGLAPIHEKEKFGFVPPAAESLEGDPCLLGDPGKRGFPEVGLHQGPTILTRTHGDVPASELRGTRSMDIFIQLLLEPLPIEKQPFRGHDGQIKPRA